MKNHCSEETEAKLTVYEWEQEKILGCYQTSDDAESECSAVMRSLVDSQPIGIQTNGVFWPGRLLSSCSIPGPLEPFGGLVSSWTTVPENALIPSI